MIKLNLIKENFWEVHPSLKYRKPFESIYKLDKDESKTSKIAWAICLFTDVQSDFRNMSEKDRVEEIVRYYLKGDNIFTNKVVIKAIEDYPEAVMSESAQYYKIWGDKLKERGLFIRDTPYVLDKHGITEDGRPYSIKGNVEQLDRMLVNSDKILSTFEKYGEKLKAEEGKGRVKGGRKESLSERKRI